jgi:hypothetical protein
MRTLIPLVVVCMALIACVPATAESFREEGRPAVVPVPQTTSLGGQGHATLQLSPMFLEIHAINEEMLATETELLADLAAATDEDEVGRLVHRLERLDRDRELAVLKVRIRSARIEGRFDEAFSLRKEMLQLLQKETAPLM